MELPVNPSQLVDLLRAWFHPKDRTIVLSTNCFIEFGEMTAPDAPTVNRARLYVKDNGSGKSQLVVRFATGAEQVIATEP